MRRKQTESANLNLRPHPFFTSIRSIQSQTTSNLSHQDDVTNRESNVDSELTSATSTNEKNQLESNSSE